MDSASTVALTEYVMLTFKKFLRSYNEKVYHYELLSEGRKYVEKISMRLKMKTTQVDLPMQA